MSDEKCPPCPQCGMMTRVTLGGGETCCNGPESLACISRQLAAANERAEKAEKELASCQAACAAWQAAMLPDHPERFAGDPHPLNEYKYIRRPEYEKLVAANPGRAILDELAQLRAVLADVANARRRRNLGVSPAGQPAMWYDAEAVGEAIAGLGPRARALAAEAAKERT